MKVLTASQIKIAEKTAVSGGLFSYAELMENAGKAVFSEICRRYQVSGKRFLVIVGSGNNGGDGIVIASLLRNSGAFVTLCAPFGLPETDTASAFLNRVFEIPVCNSVDGSYDFYIDALFGIGFNRNFDEHTESLIYTVNRKTGIKIAVDIPSGVFADGGCAQKAFCADLTVTFIGYKPAQLLPPTSSFCGEIVLNTLDIDVENNYSFSIIEPPKAMIYNKNSHKGTFGTALTVCGSYGMCGAGILSAKAALTAGAGIVKSIVCDKNYSAFTGSVPEAVTIPVETAQSGAPVIYEKTVVSAISSSSAMLIGCGIGVSTEAKLLVKKALGFTNIPTVIDADGINVLTGDINILRNIDAPVILTPHPGEMARLLNTTVQYVESHRIECARSFAAEYQCILVLKGANTIVAAPDGKLFFNVTGNYGMAKGGSGDVLSGIIVALLANGTDPLDAALNAVYVHGAAGDRAAKKYTRRTMLPSDIIRELKFISF